MLFSICGGAIIDQLNLESRFEESCISISAKCFQFANAQLQPENDCSLEIVAPCALMQILEAQVISWCYLFEGKGCDMLCYLKITLFKMLHPHQRCEVVMADSRR